MPPPQILQNKEFFMNRRKLILTSAIAAPALALSACISSATAGSIAVTLASAQAQANAILAAIETLYPSLQSKIPTAIIGAVNTDLTMLEGDVSKFVLLTPGESYVADAQAVIKDVNLILPMLPLPPATSFAVTMGLGLISALLAGISSVSAPLAAPAASGVAAPRVIPAPIPIPLG